jgi:hypothetical protein
MLRSSLQRFTKSVLVRPAPCGGSSASRVVAVVSVREQQQLRTFTQTHKASMAATTVKVTYVEGDGTETTVDAEIGKNLMDVAHDNDIELEGACVRASFFDGYG